MQKKLEIIISFERAQRTIDTLQKRFPELRVETRSSFFLILGCYVQGYSENEKQWLVALKDALVIEKFRCKEREDR